MNRRIERINNLIRNTIGELLLSKMSDPRIDPARVSITRVEVADDLLSAKVFVSVMGDEAQQRRAVFALRHAAGHIQDLMMRQIQLRSTPLLNFQIDTKFKKTLETLQIISKAMEEIRQKEEASGKDPAEPQEESQKSDDSEEK